MQYLKKIFIFIFISLNYNIYTASHNNDNNSWQALSNLRQFKFYTLREKAILFTACQVTYSSKLLYSNAQQSHQASYYNINQFHEFADKIEQGFVAPVAIKLVNPSVGYGVFAKIDIPQGAFIGEFTGEFKRLEESLTSVYYVTSFLVDTLDNYVVDASCFGNEMRFINDGKEHSNCCGWNVLGSDLMNHVVIVAEKHISSGQQLTMPYHNDYWLAHEQHTFQNLG